MKIYTIITNDRHTDIEVISYKDWDAAVVKARAMANEYCRCKEDYKEYILDCCEFSAEYSCEGDSITVIESELIGDE